jgi:hypothetical protein
MDLVPTQKQQLLDLMHHVKRNDMSSVIVKALQSTASKVIDEYDADSDDNTNQTVYCEEEIYDHDSDATTTTSSDSMAID